MKPQELSKSLRLQEMTREALVLRGLSSKNLEHGQKVDLVALLTASTAWCLK